MTQKQLNIAIKKDFVSEIQSQNTYKSRGDNLVRGRKKFKFMAKRTTINFDKVLDEYEKSDGGLGFIVTYTAGGFTKRIEYTPAKTVVIGKWEKISIGGL